MGKSRMMPKRSVSNVIDLILESSDCEPVAEYRSSEYIFPQTLDWIFFEHGDFNNIVSIRASLRTRKES